MKTNQPHRSEKCAAHLNHALCVGAAVAFLGLAGGGVIMAFPASFGIAPGDARATALVFSLASLVVGALFLAVGAVQKCSNGAKTGCTPPAQG